jgi:diaminopimelate epimerase
MRFTKMHGTGNDYVYVDGFSQHVHINDPAGLARAVSDRHCGVGSDGLILLLPSAVADVRMRMFNADGSEAEMCGNGIRCVAKYAYDHALVRVNPMRVETDAGVKVIDLTLGTDGKVAAATVDMGEPALHPKVIPVAVEGDRAVDVPISAGGAKFRMTCVSMGNPHAVIYVEDVGSVELEKLGPELEHHAIFPSRTNVQFVQVHSSGEVTMRTWERGSGATLACGTGASAVCVAGVLTGRSGREIQVHLPGGDLHVVWRQDNNHVYLTGPAVEVFSGEWPA